MKIVNLFFKKIIIMKKFIKKSLNLKQTVVSKHSHLKIVVKVYFKCFLIPNLHILIEKECFDVLYKYFFEKISPYVNKKNMYHNFF